jgi:hypothetical protein
VPRQRITSAQMACSAVATVEEWMASVKRWQPSVMARFLSSATWFGLRFGFGFGFGFGLRFGFRLRFGFGSGDGYG